MQSGAHFFLVGFCFRLNSNSDNRLGEYYSLKNYRGFRRTKSIARSGVFQPHDGGNFSGVNFFNFFALIGMHTHDTADAFLLPLGAVQYIRAAFQNSGVISEIS